MLDQIREWAKPKTETLNNPVFVWVTDIHINSKQALCAPEVERNLDGEKYYPNKAQVALFDAWKDAWASVKEKAGDRPIVIGFGGEIVDIDAKKRSNQYITQSDGEENELIIEHAMVLLRPALEMASKVIIIKGTEAHVGVNGAMDEVMARQINREFRGLVHKNSVTDEFSWHYFRGFIGGRKFDLAHHVNMGGMPRTERNAANHLAADLMMQYARWKEQFPDFAFRGHVHRVSDSSFNYPIRALIGASWQVATPFIHRIAHGGNKPEIGLLFCDIKNKEVEYINYDYKREEPEHL